MSKPVEILNFKETGNGVFIASVIAMIVIFCRLF